MYDNQIIKREKVTEGFNLTPYSSEYDIEWLYNFAETLKNSNATHFELDIEAWEGGIESIEFTGYKNTIETDEEKELRLKKVEADRRKRQQEALELEEKRERLLYESLKIKYGK